MTVKIDGTNTVANPAFTGADTDTGLQCGTDELKLVTGGSARATVDSSGNIGIGTTSPTGFSGYTVLDINNATNGAIIDLSQGDAMKGRLVATSSSMTTETSSGVPIIFSPAGTEEARFLVGGGLTFNGDTAAANALDDYEEGTWTPTVKGQTTAGTATYSHQHGRYTKIGDRVIINGYVAWGSATGTGAVLIAGLPELSLNHQYRGIQSGSAMLQNMSWASGTTSVATYLPNNSDEIQIYISGSGQSWSQHDITGSGDLIFQLTYVTAS